MRQKRLALSLRGGGSGATAYLGVLKALEEENIKVDMIIGSSAGAAVGVAYALGIPLERIIEFTKGINNKRLMGLDSLHDMTLWSDTKFERMVEDMVGEAKLEDAVIPVSVQLTNLDTKEMEIVSRGLAKRLITASMSFPFLMVPYNLDGTTYIDGDFSASYSTRYLKSNGAEFVLGMNTGWEDMNLANHHQSISSRIVEPLNVVLYQLAKLNNEIDKPDYVITDLSKDVNPIDFSRGEEMVHNGYNMTKSLMPEIKKLVSRRLFKIF
jgi:NTE family protein